MTISAINEQLLRAIGVGIAIVGEDGLSFRFHNEKFAEWFGEPGVSPMQIISDDEMKNALVEEFASADLGRHDVRGCGDTQLISLSTEIKGAAGRHPGRPARPD